MFEKEAEEYNQKVPFNPLNVEKEIRRAFQKGAEFGYNKAKEELNQKGLALQSDMDKTIEQNIALKKELNNANEWHFVKDGDLPKDTTSLYLVRVDSWNFSFSHLYKKYTTYIPTVCEWNGEYFTALDDMAYSNARNINSCVAWKEIIPPELEESE